MRASVAGVGAGVSVLVIVLLLLARRRPREQPGGRALAAETALRAFVGGAREHPDLTTVVGDAVEAAREAFGAERAVFFEPGLFDSWDARPWDREAAPTSVSDAARAVFAWFQHNPLALARAEITADTFGALERPLREVLEAWKIDTILPLVDRGQTMGILGLALGRAPEHGERDLLEYFRVIVSSAAANVRYGRESALAGTLERDLDQAAAARGALAPFADEGRAQGVSWVGHFRAAGDEPSDFVSVRDRQDGRLLVVVGKTLGRGLAASLASASVRSFCDVLGTGEGALEPGDLLQALNRALARDDRALRAACLAAVVDGEKGRIRWATAGHRVPYHLAKSAPGQLAVLAARGPYLGETAAAAFPTREATLGPGDAIVFMSDGVPDALDAGRAPFGDRRLQRLLLAANSQGPRATCDTIVRALDDHRGDAPPTDDESLLILQVGN